MTGPRKVVRTSKSANDDRPPEIRIERISAARLIEALCDKTAFDARSSVTGESVAGPQGSRNDTRRSGTDGQEPLAKERMSIGRSDRR